MKTDRRAQAPSAPEVERELAFDMLKRGLLFAPLVVILAGIPWGIEGVYSGALAVGVVFVNLVLAALGLSWAAKRSLNMIMVMALGGFAVRMGLVVAVLFAVRNTSWIDMTALGVTVLVTHLGLLVWELRYVSASLAFPGLKPTADKEAIVS